MFKPHCNQPCNLQLLHRWGFYWQLHTLRRATSLLARDPSLARQEMRANAKPAAAPRDGVPGSKTPALIKMSNQHTRLSRARTANPPKLDVQHNTQAMPVRAHHGCRAVP